MTNNKKKFVNNVIVLVGGTAGAQGITMLFSPIITRFYGPEAFGVMGTFIAITSIIAPISALTYPIAIVLPKKDKEAMGIARLSLLVSLVMAITIGFLILVLQDNIANIFDLGETQYLLYFIPVVLLFSAFVQVMEQWLIRTKQFAINAKATIYQSILINLGKVGIGFFYPFAPVLVVFTAISGGVRGFLMYCLSLNKKSLSIKYNEEVDVKKIAKEYKDFPIYRAPQDLIEAASQSIPIIMLSMFFGPASVGFYTIGRSVLNIPTSLVGKAVGDVFYPRMVEAINNKENHSKLMKRTTLTLVLIGIIPFLLVILFGPILFSFVFGPEWYRAGEYGRWIAFWSFFTFISRPTIRAIPVLNAQKLHLIWTIFWTIFRIILLFIVYKVYQDDLLTVAAFSLSGIVSYLSLMFIVIRISNKKMK